MVVLVLNGNLFLYELGLDVNVNWSRGVSPTRILMGTRHPNACHVHKMQYQEELLPRLIFIFNIDYMIKEFC